MRGSVMKRGKTWTYVISLGRDASGKKRQKWVGGHRTKKAAEDALTEALERMRTGMWIDPGTTTVGEFIAEWMAVMSSMVLDTTERSYEQMMRNWVVPRIGNIRLAELTPMHLRSLQAELLANWARRRHRRTVSPEQAAAAATAVVPGTAVPAQLGDENGNVVNEVKMTQADGTVVEVKVDAGNGSVLGQAQMAEDQCRQTPDEGCVGRQFDSSDSVVLTLNGLGGAGCPCSPRIRTASS